MTYGKMGDVGTYNVICLFSFSFLNSTIPSVNPQTIEKVIENLLEC